MAMVGAILAKGPGNMAKSKPYKMVSELTHIQCEHLAWRLDHNTWCGVGTAGQIARGEFLADKNLMEIFLWAGRTPQSAKILARKVENFKLGPLQEKVREELRAQSPWRAV